MNSVLQPFMRKCAVIFFDDIPIYSRSYIVRAPATSQGSLKRSKYAFATLSVQYLGHIISELGVSMDKEEVEAVEN